MSMQVNIIHREKSENYSDEPIMVTITLEEYRSLVEENARLINDNQRATEEIARVYAEKEKIETQWENERRWRETHNVTSKQSSY